MTRLLLVTVILEPEKGRNHFGVLSRLEWVAQNQSGKANKRVIAIRNDGNKRLRWYLNKIKKRKTLKL